MNKISIAIYGCSGSLICALALTDFMLSADPWLQRFFRLCGLLIFGLLFLGVAIARLRGYFQHAIANHSGISVKQRLALTSGALGLLLAMMGWLIAARGISLNGVAIALVLMTGIIDDWAQALVTWHKQ